ncbi:MAG: nicotinate-nucleotide adenylyltransferase [Raoultibacter sp.]
MSVIISQRFDGLGLQDPSRTYRLGIMGGTFDPIHIGHLACAEQVRDKLNLDAVLFVVAGNPVYKKGQHVTSARHRIAMCKQAIANNDAFDVSSIEVDREGDTFTVDTLRQMRMHYPDNVEFYFITGADAASHVADWKESAEVLKLAQVIAVTRPDCDVSEQALVRMESFDTLPFQYQEVTALAISSSDIRERIRKGYSVRYLTPQSVLDFIEEHGLYRASYDDAAFGEA